MTKINYHVTVVFPQTFEIELSDDLTEEEKREFILDYADYLMTTSESDPLIQSCSDPNLED